MTQLRAIIAIVGLVALIGAYFYGVSVGVDRQLARDAKAMAEATAAVAKMQDAMGALREQAARLETLRQTTVREIYRDVPTIIDRPIYSAVCVDADGVGLLDRAAAAANGQDRSGAAGSAGGTTDVPAIR